MPEEEMRTHLDLLVEENLRRGMDATEARRQAHLAFGNLLSTREETEDALGWPALESWWHDARVAARSLTRRPAFALSLVLILALGLGVTTAIFSLLRGVLWEPLPVNQPDELRLAVNTRGDPFLFSLPTVQRLADNGFRGRVAAYSSQTGAALRIGDSPAEPFRVQFVQGEFFPALQLGAHLGRTLSPADDVLGAPHPVAVVSYHWWKRRLNGDPAAIGRTLRLNGTAVTIVGVTPPAFTGVTLGDGVEAWLPAGLHATLGSAPSAMTISKDEDPKLADWVREDHVAWLNMMLRLPPGTAAQGAVEAAWQPQLAAALDAIGDDKIGAEFARNKPRLVPSPQGFSSARDSFRRVGLTLSLLVAAVVLVTVANTSTLLLLRMLSRTRELGVRLALGAGRGRLARGALMEGLMLSLAGAAAGLLLGLWLLPLLAEWFVPGTVDALPGLDWRLVGALAGFAVMLGLALGAAPAWLSARLSPQTILQQRSGGGRGSMRLGRTLIVLQLALSVMLIAVVGALALDLRRVLNSNLGFARETTLGTFFDFSAAGIGLDAQPAVRARLRAAAETLPQVRAVGFAASGPLSGSRSASGSYFRGDGVHQPAGNVQTESIDENYFNALGLALVRGRNFTAADTDKSPRVAIITQRLAREVFGDADPIGRRFGFDQNAAENDWQIIGIAPDARVNGVREEPPAMYYVPLPQFNPQAGFMVVRVAGDASAAKETLRRTISAAEPGLLFANWFTLEERVQRWLRNDLAAVRLTAGFGALALLLAIIGVLGALGYLVASRSREIAVRLAIGAEPKRIWREIVGDALRLGLAGAGSGFVLAAVLPRVLGSWMMTGLQTDWAAIAVAAAAGLGAAVAGGLLPARRAAKVDPLTLLRAE
ncbi:MAG: ABC transporter permease [Opitutae bacterium]|nr:ABC transporter permease [Opitutae bacterium]